MQEKEYTWCFACGKDNPIGLKMEFTMAVSYTHLTLPTTSRV